MVRVRSQRDLSLSCSWCDGGNSKSFTTTERTRCWHGRWWWWWWTVSRVMLLTSFTKETATTAGVKHYTGLQSSDDKSDSNLVSGHPFLFLWTLSLFIGLDVKSPLQLLRLSPPCRFLPQLCIIRRLKYLFFYITKWVSNRKRNICISDQRSYSCFDKLLDVCQIWKLSPIIESGTSHDQHPK